MTVLEDVNILVIGSASPFNVGRAVEAARRRFPGARILVLEPRRKEGATGYGGGVEIIERREVAGRDIGAKLVLFTGEGYNGLKLLAFLLPGRRLFVFTEGGGVFEWRWAERYTIRNHAAWRVRAWRPQRALGRGARAMAAAALGVLGLAGLVLWYGRLWLRRKIRR
jgi:hypothetical protein